MKNKILSIACIILLIILIILICIMYSLYKNYNLIKSIDNANMAYIDNNNYHINIKTNVNGKNFSNVDIYKKDYIIKTIYKDSENNETIYYEDKELGDFLKIGSQNNTSAESSFAEKFVHFLETYYRNLDISKITYDDDNYILIFNNSKYFFNKDNYMINKIEIYNDTEIEMEEIYTYYDNEEITDEMISRPTV